MWKVDLKKRVAIHHPSGIVMHFAKVTDAPGAWDGKILNPEVLGKMNAAEAAKLAREGGEAYLAEIKKSR